MAFDILMTIASIHPSTGGPARSVPCLGEAIHNSGQQVQLFVNNMEEMVNTDHNTGSTLISVKSINYLCVAIKKSNEKNSGSTLIHNHGIWLPLNHRASATAQRFNVPLIISPRGMLEPWARSYRNWKKTLAWYLYQRRDLKVASVLHATSEREAENLLTLGFHLPVALIPNGVNIPTILKSGKKVPNKKTALFLGRIHPVKGLVTLVQAWAKIRPENWQVLIAGPDEGSYRSKLEQEIQRHRLTDVFSFVGQIEDQDKWGLYSNADLFVLPTHSENFGIVVAEALASGVPVITTKGAPWAELEEHKCGWWIDIGVEPLVRALNEAINLPPEERQAMGLRGRQLVEQNYSWDKIGKEMFSVYEWVLHRGTQPDCVVID